MPRLNFLNTQLLTLARNVFVEKGIEGNTLEKKLAPLQKKDAEEIYKEIDSQSIRNYMERFRKVGGTKAYIPCRKGMVCPAQALANMCEKRINIFTFNESTNCLNLLKSSNHRPSKATWPIVNILHTGDHYIRLFNPQETAFHKKQCEQIQKNSGF